MSLRFRLISLVCLVLLISLSVGGVIAYSNASRSVRTEMCAAILVGRQTIEGALERLRSTTEPSRGLEELVASFKGNRHLRVRLSGQAPAIAAPILESSAIGGVPAWFAGLIGVVPESVRIPVALGARDYALVLETDPYNEMLEVWNEFTESLATLGVFCGLTILLIYIVIGRTLRPLDQLAGALEEVGEGRYRTRLGDRLAPEVARLRDSFNRMAARLSETDAENRRLNEQLVRLQEEERGELARDLHDEVGPYLFGINADAATAARLLREGKSIAAVEHVQLIAEAVRHMQREVRRMLGRLRPIGLAEFGLLEAIENQVAFWRRRRPEIRYEIAVSEECENLDELTATTICRVVRESLSNAVRHAEASLITISVERDHDTEQGRDEVRLAVADDGGGMEEPRRAGYGLLGIGERVTAARGRLDFSNTSGHGFAVVAVLPFQAARNPLARMPQPVEP